MFTDDSFAGADFLARISVTDKQDLFQNLCRRLAAFPQVAAAGFDYDRILEAINRREELASTATGDGVILPHARLEGLNEIAVVVATLDTPLPGDEAPDGLPIRIACMLLIPAGKPMEGLKFIAHFASFVKMPELRDELLEAADAEAMRVRLSHLGKNSRKAVLAGDIMGPCGLYLTADMPLTEATTQMSRFKAPIVPVLKGRKLVGQIACSNLFTLGIPNFFSQLKSVGFIRFFDPFEKYFSIEAHSNVGAVMSSDCCTFHEDATLIEIVFAISILKYQQVYVVNRENELLGVIDQTLLLERIINL